MLRTLSGRPWPPVFPDRLSMGHFLSVAADIVAGRDVNGKGFVLVEPNPGGWGGCHRER